MILWLLHVHQGVFNVKANADINFFYSHRACGRSSLSLPLQWWRKSGAGQTPALFLGHCERNSYRRLIGINDLLLRPVWWICFPFDRMRSQPIRRLGMGWLVWIIPPNFHPGEWMCPTILWYSSCLFGVNISVLVMPFCRLAMGCISPRYIYHQIKQYERERTANQSTYWWVWIHTLIIITFNW